MVLGWHKSCGRAVALVCFDDRLAAHVNRTGVDGFGLLIFRV